MLSSWVKQLSYEELKSTQVVYRKVYEQVLCVKYIRAQYTLYITIYI